MVVVYDDYLMSWHGANGAVRVPQPLVGESELQSFVKFRLFERFIESLLLFDVYF